MQSVSLMLKRRRIPQCYNSSVHLSGGNSGGVSDGNDEIESFNKDKERHFEAKAYSPRRCL